MRHAIFAAAALVLAFAGPAAAEGKPEDYLTKNGMLKETLEIRDLQGGFAGFTGHAWIIETDGSWKSARVGPNNKLDVEAKGALSKERLADLAKMLAKHDLAGLKDTGKEGTNPHIVEIKFGKHSATLNLPAGDPLPKPDPEKPTMESRFSALVGGVKGFVKEKK